MSNSSHSPHAVDLSSQYGLYYSATALLVLSLLVAYVWAPQQRQPEQIRELGGFSILTAWPFFKKRYDFLTTNFQRTGQRMFQFYVMQVSGIQYAAARCSTDNVHVSTK